MNGNNRDRQALQKEYHHLMLRIAMCELQDEELSKLTSDHLDNEPQTQTEEAFLTQTEDKTMLLIQDALRKQHRMHAIKLTFPKILRIAASLLLVFYIGLSVAMAVSYTVRVRVMELFFQDMTIYTEVQLKENPEKSFDVPVQWQGEYFPAYIPEGFEVTDLFSDGPGWSKIIYMKNGSRISFAIFDEYASGNIDTENATVEHITINGSDTMLVTKNNTIQAVWSQQVNYFTLLTIDLDRQTTLQIIQSIVKINH